MRAVLDGASTGRAVAREHRARALSQEQRLVADLAGAVMGGVDPIGTLEAAAVPACQRDGRLAFFRERGAHVQDERRLAGAAGGEIADADDRHPRSIGLCVRKAPHDGAAIEAGERSQQTGHRMGLARVPPRRLLKGHAPIPPRAAGIRARRRGCGAGRRQSCRAPRWRACPRRPVPWRRSGGAGPRRQSPPPNAP